MTTERIFRPGADHRVELLAAFAQMLLDDRRRRAPGRIFRATHDLRGAFGSFPTHLADADGIGVDDLLLALLYLRVVEEAHGGRVDDDAVARRVRQDELRRDDDFAILARQPRIEDRKS